MTDWQIVFGSQAVKPAELDSTSSKVYVYQRRNIQRVTQTLDDVTSEFWQYEERKLSREEYLKLQVDQLENENTNLQLALTELYENLLES
ncbi:MAG: hypothetical protein IJS81_12240 [Selenomonadaceae bacterium]|nr:hypothetical protein [Selenomonadaceae bacterium]